jgi:hypothetical protein
MTSIPKRALLLASAASTFFTFRYAPGLALVPGSFMWNAAALFAVLVGIKWFWKVIVLPLCLSPLRHLPTPPVCRLPNLCQYSRPALPRVQKFLIE